MPHTSIINAHPHAQPTQEVAELAPPPAIAHPEPHPAPGAIIILLIPCMYVSTTSTALAQPATQAALAELTAAVEDAEPAAELHAPPPHQLVARFQLSASRNHHNHQAFVVIWNNAELAVPTVPVCCPPDHTTAAAHPVAHLPAKLNVQLLKSASPLILI